MSKSVNESKLTSEVPEDNRPTLETENLWLRPFLPSDADIVQEYCSDKTIAANTRNIEYPYPEGAGAKWIENHAQLWLEGKAAVFAIWPKATNELAGAIGLHIVEEDQNAELGYWLGRPHWGKGICSEAAIKVVRYGLEELALHKIFAHHLTRNPASGRVLENAGMVREGLLRKQVRKWGVFEDIAVYGILQSDLPE